MLKGKTVLLGVTGGIAAYKAAALASLLIKQHAAVEVVMTKNATQFVTPLTFEQLTGRRTMVDTFDRNFSHQVEHISLAQRTDLVIIAPATANVCAKLAHGLADDMLTTTVLACRCPKLIAPAMNTNIVPAEAQEEFDFMCDGLSTVINAFVSESILHGVTDESWNAYLKQLEQYNYDYYIEFFNNKLHSSF
mgnify:CR=1 FL=1